MYSNDMTIYRSRSCKCPEGAQLSGGWAFTRILATPLSYVDNAQCNSVNGTHNSLLHILMLGLCMHVYIYSICSVHRHIHVNVCVHNIVHIYILNICTCHESDQLHHWAFAEAPDKAVDVECGYFNQPHTVKCMVEITAFCGNVFIGHVRLLDRLRYIYSPVHLSLHNTM